MVHLPKTIPDITVCVAASFTQREPSKSDKEAVQPGEIIRTPQDVYRMAKGSCEFSDVSYHLRDLKADYHTNLFVDDGWLSSFEGYAEGKFVDETDQSVIETLGHMCKPLLPLKRRLKYATEAELRRYSLVIATHLSTGWTLLWVQFTSVRPFVYIHQVDCLPQFANRISFNLMQAMKLIVANVLSIDQDELAVKYDYVVPYLEDEKYSSDALLIANINAIATAYQYYGYNLQTNQLSSFKKQTADELLEYREIPIETIDGGEELELEDGEELPDDNSFMEQVVPVVVEIAPPPKKAVAVETAATHKLYHGSKSSIYPIYVTKDNFDECKRNLHCDPKKIHILVDQYKQAYDIHQYKFYSRWTGNRLADDEMDFPIYGPTQIEYEILSRQEIVATASLLAKLREIGLNPDRKQMRSISNARRWINQRFRYNTEKRAVYYMRDREVVVPDYNDVPVIILCTYIHYNMPSPSEVYSVVRRNWYINKHAVQFVLDRFHNVKDGTAGTIGIMKKHTHEQDDDTSPKATDGRRRKRGRRRRVPS